ncbi:MAG: hypothetical protein JST80_08740 [Bdellovibrionales bacterium]|nr:hypothetical protein [Bdellovibrionales bacterium]
MKTLLILSVVFGFSTAAAASTGEAFPAVPSTLVSQYKDMKKLKTQSERLKAYEKIAATLKELEQDLYDHPNREDRGYDSLAVFTLKGLFRNIKNKGLTPEGCKVVLKLIPYWSDPQLSKIDDASEPAQFSYAVVKSACRQ